MFQSVTASPKTIAIELTKLLLAHPANFTHSELSFASSHLTPHHLDASHKIRESAEIIASALLVLRPMLPILRDGAKFGFQSEATCA